MKKSKNIKRKPYKKNKSYYKSDKLFVVLIIIIIIFIVNLFLLGFYLKNQNDNKKQKKDIKDLYNIKIEKDDDILFLGDSITDYYDLNKYYGIPIVNSGVSGWTTDDILEHLDEKVYKYNPKKLFLLIGTNDIQKGKNIDYIIDNIKKIVSKIKYKKKKTQIYIESIYPINNTNNEKINNSVVGIRNNDFIIKLNKKLSDYCKNNEIVYINMYDKLIDENGNLKLKYTKEGLHISDDGYKLITHELLNYIND